MMSGVGGADVCRRRRRPPPPLPDDVTDVTCLDGIESLSIDDIHNARAITKHGNYHYDLYKSPERSYHNLSNPSDQGYHTQSLFSDQDCRQKPYDLRSTKLDQSYQRKDPSYQITTLTAEPNYLSTLTLDQGYHTLPGHDPRPPHARLPDRLWLNILSHLDLVDLSRCARVCRRFSRLSSNPCLWKVVKLPEECCGANAARSIATRLGPTGCAAVLEWRTRGPKAAEAAPLIAAFFRQLTHVAICGSVSMDARAVAELLELPELKHLDLSGCARVEWPGSAGRRPALQFLDLTECTALTDAGLRAALATCPNLIYLYLRRCTYISDGGVRWIPAYCPSLKELSVSDCLGITDFGLYELAKLGPSLRYLSVAKCNQVSDAGISALARRCYRLRYVNVRGVAALGDTGATALARACSRLRALDLGATDVGDQALQILARCCPNLKKLALRGCESITDEGIQAIAYYCRGLRQLNIQDCHVTIRGYRAVKMYCKRCVIEHTNPGFC